MILFLVGFEGQEVDKILSLKGLARNEVLSEFDEELLSRKKKSATRYVRCWNRLNDEKRSTYSTKSRELGELRSQRSSSEFDSFVDDGLVLKRLRRDGLLEERPQLRVNRYQVETVVDTGKT